MRCLLCGATIEDNKKYCCEEHRKIDGQRYSGESYIEYCERRAKYLQKKVLRKKSKHIIIKRKPKVENIKKLT